MYYHIVSVFKNGPSKFCGRQSLKNSKWYDRPKQTISYHFKFFKGCLPQILLVSFLDTVTHMWVIIAIAAIIESNNNNILQEKQSNQRTYFTENTWKWGLSLIRKLSYLHIYVFFMLSLFVMLILLVGQRTIVELAQCALGYQPHLSNTTPRFLVKPPS